MDNKDAPNDLTNKYNALSESNEMKLCVNPNGLGIGKFIGGKAIVSSNRNCLAPEDRA